MTNKDGGNQDPGTPTFNPEREEKIGEHTPSDMTLRDHVAFQAMQGILANPQIVGWEDGQFRPDERDDMNSIVEWAYEISRLALDTKDVLESPEEV